MEIRFWSRHTIAGLRDMLSQAEALSPKEAEPSRACACRRLDQILATKEHHPPPACRVAWSFLRLDLLDFVRIAGSGASPALIIKTIANQVAEMDLGGGCVADEHTVQSQPMPGLGKRYDRGSYLLPQVGMRVQGRFNGSSQACVKIYIGMDSGGHAAFADGTRESSNVSYEPWTGASIPP